MKQKALHMIASVKKNYHTASVKVGKAIKIFKIFFNAYYVSLRYGWEDEREAWKAIFKVIYS